MRPEDPQTFFHDRAISVPARMCLPYASIRAIMTRGDCYFRDYENTACRNRAPSLWWTAAGCVPCCRADRPRPRLHARLPARIRRRCSGSRRRHTGSQPFLRRRSGPAVRVSADAIPANGAARSRALPQPARCGHAGRTGRELCRYSSRCFETRRQHRDAAHGCATLSAVQEDYRDLRSHSPGAPRARCRR